MKVKYLLILLIIISCKCYSQESIEWLIPLEKQEYEKLSTPFINGVARVKKGNKTYLINKENKIIHEVNDTINIAFIEDHNLVKYFYDKSAEEIVDLLGNQIVSKQTQHLKQLTNKKITLNIFESSSQKLGNNYIRNNEIVLDSFQSVYLKGPLVEGFKKSSKSKRQYYYFDHDLNYLFETKQEIEEKPFYICENKAGMMGIFDVKNYKMSTFFEFDSLSNITRENSLFRYHHNKKCGIIDMNGNILMEPKFKSINRFNQYAYVADKGKNKKVILNNDFQETMVLKTPDINNMYYDLGEFIMQQDSLVWFLNPTNHKYELFNIITGKELVPAIYNSVNYFNGSICKVSKDKKCGIIDRTGNLIHPIEYEYNSSNSIALVEKPIIKEMTLLTNDDTYLIIDTLGNIVLKEDNGKRKLILGEFISFYIGNNRKEIGTLSTNGDIDLPLSKYSEIIYYKEQGIYIYRKEGKYGIYNVKHELNIFTDYTDIVPFKTPLYNYQNLFVVKKNGKTGVINSKGEIVIEPIYTSITPILESNFLILDLMNDISLYNLEALTQSPVLFKESKRFPSRIYLGEYYKYFKFFPYRQNTKWGFMNTKFESIMDPQFISIKASYRQRILLLKRPNPNLWCFMGSNLEYLTQSCYKEVKSYDYQNTHQYLIQHEGKIGLLKFN